LNGYYGFHAIGGTVDAVVVSLGGSVLVPGEDDVRYLQNLAEMLVASAASLRIYAVTGGGRTARWYIEAGRALGADETFLDGIGIDATRANAKLLIAGLGDAAPRSVPTTTAAAARLGRRGRVVVMGGTTPGHTTDLVAAQLARAVRAKRLVNATSVDGVYDRDPRGDPGARRLDALGYGDLVRIAGSGHDRAGPAAVFDPQAARFVARWQIPVAVVHGRDLTALRDAIFGRPFRGTTVGAWG